MQTKFIEGCQSAREARRRMPWAVAVAKCDGGYMAFASMDDYRIWKSQK